MFQGTIKKSLPERGFAFIERDDGGDNVFVHISEAQASGISSLDVGQRLSFDVEPDPRNPRRFRARNVQLVV